MPTWTASRSAPDPHHALPPHPTLIQRGYVYRRVPLYEITCKEKTWFAYSDAEKNEIVNGELAGKKCTINRSKGLGENEPDMMWLTTMNPETRRLIKVMPEDVERTAQVFDLLLGTTSRAGRITSPRTGINIWSWRISRKKLIIDNG